MQKIYSERVTDTNPPTINILKLSIGVNFYNSFVRMANTYRRMLLLSCWMVAAISFYSCKRPAKVPVESLPGSSSEMIDTNFHTIIPFDTVTLGWVFEKAMPADLSVAEVAIADGIVEAAITEWNNSLEPGAHFRVRPFKEYKRQLVAVINANGEKEVWVNCFCDRDWGRYRENLLVVDDGGTCYFNVKINLTTKTSYDLMVNGDA
jgi:hypothetical protein